MEHFDLRDLWEAGQLGRTREKGMGEAGEWRPSLGLEGGEEGQP